MSLTTNNRTHDSSPSKSMLVGQPAERTQQSRFQKIIQLFLSFNVDRKETDENNHQHAKLVLSTFFIYMIFVTNVLVVAMLTQSSHSFLITDTFEHHLLRARFPVKAKWLEREARFSSHQNRRKIYAHALMIDFNQITTFQDIWQFMNETIGHVFYHSANRRVSAQHSIRWILDHFLIIGVVRMRQVRVKAEKCNIPKAYSDEIADCYPAYSPEKKDTDPCKCTLMTIDFALHDCRPLHEMLQGHCFLVGPLTLSDSTHINLKQPWRYMSAAETEMDSYTGQYGKYDASGYVADLAQYERTSQRFVSDLNELKRFHWLDKATRAVFVDTITYNPSLNLFSYIKLVFEMPLTGGIFPSHKIENRQLFRYVSSRKYVLIVCEVAIVAFTLIFLFVEIVIIVKSGLKIFLSFWNWIDMILLIVSVLLIIGNVCRLVVINRTVNNRMSIHWSTFHTLTVKLLHLQSLFDTFSVLLTSISLLRIMKYCDFAMTLIRIKATIRRCFGDLIGFLIMFVAIMIAYAQFGNLVLGQQAAAFSSVGKAFVALFRTVLSDFDYEDISDAAPVVGSIFFFLYIFSMVFMLFNMVLAIIVDSYEELGSEHRDVIHQMLIDVTPFIKHSIQIFFERLRIWTKVKVIVHFIIRADDSTSTKTIRDLLQEFKYSATSSSIYEELRRAFAHEMTKSISKKDFDAFLKYAHSDKDRQRDTLQSLFTGNKSLINVNEEQEWNKRACDLCTMQQWAQLRYRLARLEELLDLLEGKIDYTMRTSENLLRTVTLPLESSQQKENL